MEALETLDNLNFPEQIKTIDICACGPLRVSGALVKAGLLKEGSKIIMITSQGGSITWRTTQNPTGHDYGHHVCLLFILACAYWSRISYMLILTTLCLFVFLPLCIFDCTLPLNKQNQMSKAAANMMAVLLAQELKQKGIAVGVFHPGFNKTGMTAKYKDIWEVEGAVDAAIGAKRIFYEVGRLSMATTGKFINCEDGLEIPW